MFDLIDGLRKNGYKTVLLSDQTNEWWPILDAKWSISSHFDVCIISSEVGTHKPEPEIYKIALERSDSRAEKSIFIDDLEHNLKPAEELGMGVVLFKDCQSLKKELRSLSINFN